MQSSLLFSSILTLGLIPGSAALAQDGDSGTGYRVEENSQNTVDKAGTDILSQAPNSVPAVDQKTQGPVRLARFASIKGNVVWRADDSAEWAPATVNMPLRQGAQIWVTESGRAEVQFDDGSALRLGNNALVTMKLFYSDADGEFTQITMNEGLATLHSRRDVSVYQVDTPLLSVKTKGEAQVRFGIGGGSEIAVQRGDATIEGQQGKLTMHQNEYLDVADASAAYTAHRVPEADSWDRWNADRNRFIDDVSKTSKHVPANVGIVAGELDDYGDWREDPKYGSVWVPRNTEEGWRPYSHGRWTWVDPFGWTWVGEEPWGWAPYHYGTWVNHPYGWAWCPGPAAQYWSPGVVGFSVYAGSVAWAPLCPWEVRYPSAFSLGIWGGNWGFNFSIGSCGVYYPGAFGYCVGRPFDNYYINRFGYGYGGFGHGGYGERFGYRGNLDNGGNNINVANITNNYNHNTLAGGNHFVPYNASHGAGSTVATAEAFGGRGKYNLIGKGDTSYFAHGQSVAPAGSGRAPASGPASVQPTRLSTTPTRSFASNVHVPQPSAQRSVFQAPLPSNVQHSLPASAQSANAGNSAVTRPGQSAALAARQAGNSSLRVNGNQTTSSANANSARTAVTEHTASSSSLARPADNRGSSAAEAARSARASLGITGREQSAGQSGGSYTRNGGGSGSSSYSNGGNGGGNTGRYSGAESNSGQRYPSSGSSGRTYSGGEYQVGNSGSHSAPSSGTSGSYRSGSYGSMSGGYRAGESGGYRGGGYTGSSTSHSSGGGSSSGVSHSSGSGGGTGGGNHSGGGSAGGHGR